MSTNAAMIAANEQRWADARITRPGLFPPIAGRLAASAAKARYEAVSAQTKVPWQVIAVTHERECSQNWSRSLAQGDPWNQKSTHVPKGRGPFSSWEACAIDALMKCPPYAGLWTDWSVGGMLTLLEKYNGVGYAAKGRPSPYIWAGTNQYTSGKYVADGVYDPGHVDKQPGCAGLLKAMMEIDPSIRFGAPAPRARPTPEPPKEIVKDATGNERKARTGGVVSAGAGGGSEAGKASTTQPDKVPFLHSHIAYAMIGVGVAVAIVATVLIARKVKAINDIW